jgi:hypothetical protein
MFTWICPQCGREVPPAYNECPDCTAKAAQAAAEPPPPPQPAAEAAPPPAYVPPPPQPRISTQHSGLPIWLLTVVFAFAFVGLGAGVYWVVQVFRGSHQATTPSINVESPAAKAGAKTNPLQKYIEVSGLRFTQDAKKKTIAKFVLINHSEADLTGLAGNVTIWGRTQKSEEDAQGTFSFTTNLGPLESKELSAPVDTKFRIYELPDWQNVTLDLQITAPTGD